MNSIQILATGSYLPKQKIENATLNERFNLQEGWIEKRTGIQTRYLTSEETIIEMAVKAVGNLLKNTKLNKQEIDMIVVASTSSKYIMPSISFFVQKKLEISECICMDVLAGCSGYINAFDIIRNYITLGKIQYGIVVGVEELSTFTDQDDINTAILLSDGAGATLLGKSEKEKKYDSLIESQGQFGEILTCTIDEKIKMNGREIYKYASSKTVENIKKLLKKNQIGIEDITYMIPHQSNTRILKTMGEKLNLNPSKIYLNISEVGNTFCASIPIALDEMFQKKLLKEGDKIILLGYGGGLNLGSIVMEV